MTILFDLSVAIIHQIITVHQHVFTQNSQFSFWITSVEELESSGTTGNYRYMLFLQL